MKKRVLVIAICALMCIMLVGCDGVRENDPEKQQAEVYLHSSIQDEVDSPDWVKKLPDIEDKNQLLIVAGMGMDKSTAYVSLHNKDKEGNWKQILSTPGVIGKNGMVLDEEHKEGSDKTPIGRYRIKRNCGIAPSPGCKMPYTSVIDAMYWTGETDGEIPFNALVNIKQYKDLDEQTSEHLYELEYEDQFCIGIDFNPEEEIGKGSQIFIKCLSSDRPYTNGSVEIPEDIMKLLIKNILQDCVIIIDTMDNLGAEF